MTITVKIVLLVVVVAGASMGTVNYLAVSNTEKALFGQLNQAMDRDISYFETWLHEHRQEVERTATIVAQNPDISRALDLGLSRGVGRSLNRTITVYPSFKYILVVDSDGVVFAANTKDRYGKRMLGEQLLGLDVREQLLLPGLGFSVTAGEPGDDPYASILGGPSEPGQVQWLVAPVTKRGVFLGWAVLAYLWQEDIETHLNQFLELLRSTTGQTNDVAVELVAKNGIVTVSTADTKGQLLKTSNERIWKQKEIQIGGANFMLAVSADRSSIVGPVDRASRQLTLTILAGTLVLIVSLITILRLGLLRKIRSLHRCVTEFRQGNYELRVNLPGRDEISALGGSFNAMADNLSAALDGLQSHGDRLELEVIARTAELRRSNEELDDFAYIASHDLKEPLRGLHNYSQFLLEDYSDKLDDEGVSKLNTLLDLTKRMDVLINSLLEFSRVGRTDLAVKQTDLNQVLSDVVESLKIRLEEEDVEVRIPKPLPTIVCDQARIGEVFRNLITNSMKYNDKNKKWIEIGAVRNDEYLNQHIFYVRDNGIGIRERHIESIFKIFKRLNGRNKYGGGTGVGLTFVKKIVERHAGNIWVESTFGEGTTFYFTLSDVTSQIRRYQQHDDTSKDQHPAYSSG